MTQRIQPKLVIDDEQYAYVEGTLKAKLGLGEVISESLETGGGIPERVEGKDLKTREGMVTFDLPTRTLTIEQLQVWSAAIGQVVIQLIYPNGSLIFTRATLVNDPELNFGSDGNVTLEFKSLPAQ